MHFGQQRSRPGQRRARNGSIGRPAIDRKPLGGPFIAPFTCVKNMGRVFDSFSGKIAGLLAQKPVKVAGVPLYQPLLKQRSIILAACVLFKFLHSI